LGGVVWGRESAAPTGLGAVPVPPVVTVIVSMPQPSRAGLCRSYDMTMVRS
jgi:hypothetical protein